MTLRASVNGRKALWFRVDTGCATPLQWVNSDVKPMGCATKIAVGLAELGIPQTRTTVKIGQRIFTDVGTGLHTSPIFDGEAGLVGNGLLSAFEAVTLDTVHGQIILGPRLISATQ
jgi:hypothetical protein